MAKLSDLQFDKRNARKHPQRNMGAIMQSLQEVGAARSIVIDEDNIILAGNGVIEAAGQVGIENVRIIEADGNEIIAVKRKGLTQEQKTRLALFDNRAGELAEWDTDEIRTLLDEGFNFDGLFFENELDALLAELHTDVESGLLEDADPDAIPESAETRCKPGDLWQLGRHRLLCGDSTSATDVESLMGGQKPDACITDPPYNVGLNYDDATNDDKSNDGYDRFSQDWFSLVECEKRIVTAGCSNLQYWLTQFPPQAMGVWIKLNAMTRASATRFNCWEPILFYGCKNTSRASDVFDFAVGMQKDVGDHPCPKPANLWIELLNCYTEDGALLYEPFGGSGTTIVAAEQTKRTCYAMEHSEHYCDVILTRWERATGKTAELMNGTTN